MVAPLEGVRVLDVTRYIAGPYCGQILGDLGADVVKLEKADQGDDARDYYPRVQGESLYYLAFNRNKRGITINFRHPRGPDLLRRLAARADVLVENFRPGIMAAMGCSYPVLSELNPRLIMASITGFGQDGPYSQRPAFDAVVQAMTGWQMMNGWPGGPPTQVGNLVGDQVSGLYAIIGILAALRRRDETGRGQHVNVTLLNTLLSMLMTAIPESLMLGLPARRNGNRARYGAPPCDSYPTSDGWVHILSGSNDVLRRMLKVMGREELLQDPRYATPEARRERPDEVNGLVAEWTIQRTGDEIEALMVQAGVPCSKVCDVTDVVKNPQVLHRKQIVEVEHPTVGTVPLHGITIEFSETPGEIRRAAPLLGQHNEEVYGEWLGLSPGEVAALREEHVI